MSSESSDIDAEDFGFDGTKEMGPGGVVKQGVKFAEGEALEEVAPATLMRTLRKDVGFPKQYEKHVRVQSDLIMETKQSDETMLEKEAHEVFVSRKFR